VNNGRFLIAMLVLSTISSSSWAQNEDRESPKQKTQIFAPKKTLKQWDHDRYTLESMFLLLNAKTGGSKFKYFDFSIEQRDRVNRRLETVLASRKAMIEKLGDNVSRFKLKVQNNPGNRGLVVKYEEAEDQFQDYIADLISPAYKLFQEELKPIQYQRLKGIGTYQATARYFVQYKYSDFLDDDQYTKWPLWIAEAEGLDRSVIRKIKKATKVQTKKYDEEVDKFLESFSKTLSTTKLSSDQKKAFKKFEAVFSKRREKRTRQFFKQLAGSKNVQGQFDFTPKQEKSIEKIMSDFRKETRLEDGRPIRNQFGIRQIDQIRALFSKTQKKAIQQRIERAVVRDMLVDLDPYYKKIYQATEEKNGIKDLARRMFQMEVNRQKLFDKKDQLIRQAVTNILKSVSKTERKKIEKYLGERKSLFSVVEKRYRYINDMIDQEFPSQPSTRFQKMER